MPFSVSFLVPERTAVGDVLAKLQGSAPADIYDLQWKENYTGGSIPAGKISMTFAMNFKLPDRTMKGEEIQALQDKIIKHAATHGYLLRTN